MSEVTETETKNKGGAPLGNQNSRRGRIFRQAVQRQITIDEQRYREDKGHSEMRRINRAACKLMDFAAEGTEWAIKELNRVLDGRSLIEVGDDAEGTSINIFAPGALEAMPPERMIMLQALLKELKEAASAARQK